MVVAKCDRIRNRNSLLSNCLEERRAVRNTRKGEPGIRADQGIQRDEYFPPSLLSSR